jgi:2-C-methyl-D-erythritol 4-phosphate cytidylyltransferase
MHLLIPAAGMGRRMGSDRNKLLLTLLGKPLMAWTLLTAEATRHIQWIGIIGQPEDWPNWRSLLQDLPISKPVALIPGGITRQASVYNGLQALPVAAERVLIHDGARCLATPDLIDRCAEALANYSGLIAAVRVKDTIKVVDQTGLVQSTPNRSQLWAAQTPQGFVVEKLKHCHAEGHRQGWEVTDDANLICLCRL